MTSDEITGTPTVWDEGLTVRQRQLRSDQRRQARLIGGADIVVDEGGADVTIYLDDDGQQQRRHVDFTSGDFSHQAVAHVLALFSCTDGRLLHNADFAPALRAALLGDAKVLRDQLKTHHGPAFWTLRRPWVVEWLDDRMRAGYSAPYRNTIYQPTLAIQEKERLFSGEPEGPVEPAGTHERRSEYVRVRQLVASKLEPEDSARVMEFIDRIARERGWALTGLLKARDATALALETFAANTRNRPAAREPLATTTPAPPVTPDARPALPPPHQVAERSRGAQRSGPA